MYRWLFVSLEHEACSRDITELKWHLKLENQKVTQVQKKLLQADLMNRNLQEDVEFARNQIPVVRDNLDRQKDILNQIDTAQAEVWLSLTFFTICKPFSIPSYACRPLRTWGSF